MSNGGEFGKRIALVAGNSASANVGYLENPKRDASAGRDRHPPLARTSPTSARGLPRLRRLPGRSWLTQPNPAT